MPRSRRTPRRRAGSVVALAALLALAGCGAASDDGAGTAEPGATDAAGTAALELSEVSFDVRRDPG